MVRQLLCASDHERCTFGTVDLAAELPSKSRFSLPAESNRPTSPAPCTPHLGGVAHESRFNLPTQSKQRYCNRFNQHQKILAHKHQRALPLLTMQQPFSTHRCDGELRPSPPSSPTPEELPMKSRCHLPSQPIMPSTPHLDLHPLCALYALHPPHSLPRWSCP